MSRTIIEILANIPEGSDIAKAYANRVDAREQAELSYLLLLEPETDGPVSLTERRAVGAFLAALYGEPATQAYYKGLLHDVSPELAQTISLDAEAARSVGPWGTYPAGPLSVEDQHGIPWVPTLEQATHYGRRLTAALVHAHLLAQHPRDASPAALAALFAAGWDEDGIVVLSQLVSFLSFQIRVIAGFSALVAARTGVDA